MQHRAKLFANGRSQAVRLPAAFRFEGDEVFIRRDEATGDVILSRKPENWDDVLALINTGAVPAGFLSPEERDQGEQDRDPLADWSE
jgi:antitoxin VapB